MKQFKKFKNITIISIMTTFGIYLINQIIFFFSGVNDTLYPKNGSYYHWRFGNIFYTKQGKGRPLLLIHHLSSDSSNIEYHKIIEPLSKNHTVYSIDFIGCGRSDKPKITYTSYLYVQLINDFIKNVIKGKTDVISCGKSCSIILQASNIEQENFHKLLFINPENVAASNAFPSKRKILLKYLIEFPILGTLIYNILESQIKIEQRFQKKYFHSPAKIKRSYINAYYESAHYSGSASKYLYASIKSGYLNCHLISALKNTNHSIYLAIGEDIPDAQNTLEQYQVLNPSIEGSFIKNTKHLPQLEDAQSVLNLCNIFF